MRETPLTMNPEEFRRLGHALVDSVAAFLGSLPGRPVTTGESPGAIRGLLDAGRHDPYLNALNEALLERIQSSGEAFVSNAVVRGRYLLRACIVNFHTGAADVDALPEIVVRLGREVDARMRALEPGQS
jgi:hypothetical protein